MQEVGVWWLEHVIIYADARPINECNLPYALNTHLMYMWRDHLKITHRGGKILKCMWSVLVCIAPQNFV